MAYQEDARRLSLVADVDGSTQKLEARFRNPTNGKFVTEYFDINLSEPNKETLYLIMQLSMYLGRAVELLTSGVKRPAEPAKGDSITILDALISVVDVSKLQEYNKASIVNYLLALMIKYKVPIVFSLDSLHEQPKAAETPPPPHELRRAV